MENQFNIQKLKYQSGQNETTELNLVVDMETGKAALEIKKTIIETYKTNMYDDVIDVYDRITGGNGRKLFKIKDFF